MLKIGFSVSTGHRNRSDYKGVFRMKTTSIYLALCLLVNVSISFAESATPLQKNLYYGKAFYSNVLPVARDEKLKSDLKTVLKSGHVQVAGEFDQLVQSCESQKNCTVQTSIGYDGARRFLFGKFYLVQIDSANYGIKEMYCDRIYQGPDFNSGEKPGPGVIPDNTVINIEHTWPQSRFNRRYPKDIQKADMHHLFPTDSQMNATRGNNIFGIVTKDDQHVKCSASRSGQGSEGSSTIFEPPNQHKGHVARALFYFSIRYDIAISPAEEVVLKNWDRQFPVDDEERSRNDEIYKLQKNRNPFIDHPELAKNISDF